MPYLTRSRAPRATVIRLFLTLLFVLALFVALLLINTMRFRSAHAEVAVIDLVAVDEAAVVEHLAGALRFQTVSSDEGEVASQAFADLHAYLERTFPRVHASLTKEMVGEQSVLYRWQGRDDALKPVLLMGHLDVVPVEASTLAQWTHPPFAGQVADGYVWGRGTLDDKGSVLATLEAVELLLAQNVQPARTVYLAFGHDEELGGDNGAARMAALLRERQVDLEFILDEGFFISDGIVPNVSKPVALVGVAEKGFLNLELSVEGTSGHASVPPSQTAIGVLSAALARLESHPMPGSIDGVVGDMFATLGPEMPLPQRLVFANLWLFRPLVERQLAASPTSNALIRSTTAVTMIEGGVKVNVLPASARAVVNVRILPGDTSEEVIAHIRAAIADPRVAIIPYGTGNREPSAVSSTDAPSFALLERTIRQVFPDVLVAPAQVVGGTDTGHYAGLTDNVYRFVPHRYRPEDVARFHGDNERIAVADYVRSVQFYHQLISNAAQSTAP